MWKISEDGTRADNKREKATMFACATVISNYLGETRVLEMCHTVDEAKAVLAEIVAKENAEEEEDLWQIDDDGNAFSADGKIFRVPVTDNGILQFKFIVVMKTIGIFDKIEFMGFAYDEKEAREQIKFLVEKNNAKILNGDDDEEFDDDE